MSLKDCIDNALAGGFLSPEEAEALKKRYDALAKQVFAKGTAKDQLIAEIEKEAAHRKKVAGMVEEIRQNLEPLIVNHTNEKGQKDPAGALKLLFERFGGEEAKFDDVANRQKALLSIIMGDMTKVVRKFREDAKITGDLMRRMPEKAASLDNMVKEMFGHATNDREAAELAQITMKTLEDLRQMFNAAGGAIGKLENYGLPQHHNREALLTYTRGRWVDYMIENDMIDRDRTVHPLTGSKYSDEEFTEMLEFVWDRITSDGMNTYEPTGQERGKGALFKQHADHRFLHFKDPEKWLRYQKDFGEGDAFASIMNHISMMTRDIALMQVMGPNPVAMFTYLKNVVDAQAKMARPIAAIRKEQFTRMKELLKDAPKSIEELRVDLVKETARLDALRRDYHLLDPEDGEKVQAKISDLRNKIAAQNYKVNQAADAVSKELTNKEWAFPGDEDGARRSRAEREIQKILDKMPEEIPYHVADPISYANKEIAKAERVFDSVRGGMNVAVDERWAKRMQATRNWVSASKLGGASLSATTDVGYQAIARQVAGMPSDNLMFKTVAGYVNMLAPGGRQAAVEAGMFFDAALNTLNREARMAGSINATGITGYMANRVLTLNGLIPFTQAGRDYFGMAFSSEVAKTRGTPLKDLPEVWRRTFERNGMTADEWARLADIPATRVRGVDIMRPKDIYAVDPQLALKYLGIMHRFSGIAVPESTHRARAFMSGGNQPGTPMGEFSRLALQFKSFSIGLSFTHIPLITREWQRGNRAPAAIFGASMFLRMMVLGAIVVQLKNLAYGRDPQPMDDPKFWLGAAAQGGGIGIFGDFIFADQNRFGSGLESTIAGPVIGSLLDPALKLTIGNLRQTAEGKDTNFAREAVRFAKGMNPVGTFYTRLAADRMIFDQLEQWADPHNFRRRAKNARRARERDYNSGFWWGAGEEPRAPDMGAILSK